MSDSVPRAARSGQLDAPATQPGSDDGPHAEMVGQAYQIVGALAHYTGTFDNADVIRALDYLSGGEYRDDFLPWPAAPISPWQPIETAPKDGTRVILCGGGFVDAGTYWRNANPRHPRERWVWNGWRKHEPTHWQPLPEPPK